MWNWHAVGVVVGAVVSIVTNWLAVVPLKDNLFNHAKSNLAWIEATCAGAMTLAPDWPEWRRPGVSNYESPLNFKKLLRERLEACRSAAASVYTHLDAHGISVDLVFRLRQLRERVLRVGRLGIDTVARSAAVDGTPLVLTTREFALLEVFLQNPGRILPRTLIAEKIWEAHYDIDGNLLDVYMSKLRSKFDTDTAKPLFKTVREETAVTR